MANVIEFEFQDNKNQKYVCPWNSEQDFLEITDGFISKLCERNGIDNIKRLTMRLGCNNIGIKIHDYTLTKAIYISDFYNIKSYISIFQILGTNIHINNQNIGHLQVDCKEILLADCIIKKIELGIFDQSERLKNNDTKEIFKMDSFDVRHSTINKCDIYAECKKIEINHSSINEFNNLGNLCEKYTSSVDNFFITQNTNIGRLSLFNKVKKFNLSNSVIDNFFARAKLYLEEIKIDESFIGNTYGFSKNTFKELSYETWCWIEMSASNEHNLQIKTEANYQKAKIIYQKQNKVDIIISDLFDFCVGYGYKPFRIVRIMSILAGINAILFTICDIVNKGATTLEEIFKGFFTLGKYILWSIAIYAGQIQFEMEDGLPFWSSVIEYLLGVVLFAMFVNALYVRYKE